MLRHINMVLLILVFTALNLSANGLMMPADENYPKDFLRNTVTNINVNINGLVAETYVYQEFENEWFDSTDVVYSFPLPPDARATEFIYWYNDTTYTAVLKVKDQAVNPGTGEGGVAALVNRYIGRNGIKIFLKGIAPGTVQKVQLKYISVCDYYMGQTSYKFPLNTSEFVTYPLENLSINVNVISNSAITGYESISFADHRLLKSTDNELKINITESKAYLNKDFEFSYTSDQSEMSVDFYSAANDTTDGHFALFIRPEETAREDSVHPQRIIFLLSTSTSMRGYRLEQSVTAIKSILDKLSSKDVFNIVAYNNNINKWKNQPVQAAEENISSAKAYLNGITTNHGFQLQSAIEQCYSQIEDNNYNNIIYAFTDGRASINPRELEANNPHTTGIFPIGIGDDLLRARLEMTAALNYGFVTYIDDNDNMTEKIERLYDLTRKPLLKEVGMELGHAGLSHQMPVKTPSLYAGSMFYMSGRYKNAGSSGLAIAGRTINGTTSYNFMLDFSDRTNVNKFTESLWAKMMIDAIEWEIEIYGESVELKEQLIKISLDYNIRCRYTAYIADYETIGDVTDAENIEPVLLPESYIAGNYPNPFNPSTTIRIFIGDDDADKVKLLRVFNMLGQLVTVIDISNLSPGWQNISFNGRDMYGNVLSSGIYFVQFVSGGNPVNTIRMNLVK